MEIRDRIHGFNDELVDCREYNNFLEVVIKIQLIISSDNNLLLIEGYFKTYRFKNYEN